MIRRLSSASARALAAAACLALVGATAACDADPQTQGPRSADAGAEYGVVIHGGAGTITREDMTAEREAAYHAALEEAVRAGYEVLDDGGSALDAVAVAVMVMEDDSLFNAGRGSVFTAEGTNELDAAIMDGATRDAGAVAGVKRIRNPIVLARLVMDESPHVFMAGEGAETFGRRFAVEEVDEEYFFTGHRWEALERAQDREDSSSMTPDAERDPALGTVGAVARDRAGNLAAATSTGGMTNKRFGRIGDVPVIGAGTYADNESCAISATGHGEYFIRNVVSHDICARMIHAGATLSEAAHQVVMERLLEHGGTGGVIGIDGEGRITLTLNTPGMYRGYMLAGEEPVTKIYADEGGG